MEKNEITNQITLDYFKSKVQEINNIPIQDRITTIDNYIESECDKINKAFKEILIAEKRKAIQEIFQREQELQRKMTELQQKISEYDKDMEQIEYLRKLKRR